MEKKNGMKFFAHSLAEKPVDQWQLLDQHLIEVGRLASQFASIFGAKEWGYLAGVWHDLGKYSQEFQAFLRAENGLDANIENIPGRIDHSTAGAQHAVGRLGILGHLLAYVIAGHHTGLLDGISELACQQDRLRKKIHSWDESPQEIKDANTLKVPPQLPQFLIESIGKRDGFSISFFVRMLYSCLVDADFLDTEKFLKPQQAGLRAELPDDILVRMENALNEYAKSLGPDDTPLNKERSDIRRACLSAGIWSPGFFSLTVPTGGGKTLSSLAFGLRHALTHGLRRIIYVVPFTTIIEQNADVFRNVMRLVSDVSQDLLVIEHHSNFDPKKETTQSRLACENWDAPLIITTSVQFYESLFSDRSSSCRKLHNMAKAVIILDEAQLIPIDFLQPSLKALNELVANYGSSVVLCTATQPAVHKRLDFSIGIENVREIIHEPKNLYRRFNRVTVINLGAQKDTDIVSRILNEKQVLCIVNTRSHAKKLFADIGEAEGHYHLSALMCPAHRKENVDIIKGRLKEGSTCRVISTQLIEAGVDIDFPVVFRSMAGLDSIAQAAGRCNRNGRINGMGKTYIFQSEHPENERFLSDTTNCAAQVLDIHKNDPLELETLEQYFKLYYWDQSARWDIKKIVQSFSLVNDNQFPFLFNFRRVAKSFKIIAEDTRPVIIPWGDAGKEICTKLRAMPALDRDMIRLMQRYTVQIKSRLWMENLNKSIEPLLDKSLAILISPELHYSEAYGLNLDNPPIEAFYEDTQIKE